MSGFNVEHKKKKLNSIWMDFLRIAVLVIGMETLWISYSHNLLIELGGVYAVWGMIPVIVLGYFIASSNSWISGKVSGKKWIAARLFLMLVMLLILGYAGRNDFIDGGIYIFDGYAEISDQIYQISQLEFIRDYGMEIAWVVLLPIFLLSMLYTRLMEIRRGFWVIAIIQMSPLFVVLTANHLPEYYYFVILPVSFVMILVSSYGNRAGQVLKKEIVACVAMAIVMIFTGINEERVNNYKKYKEENYLTIRSAIKEAEEIDLMTFFRNLRGGDFATQGIGKGKLAGTKSFHPTKKSVASVIVHGETDEMLYLRSFVASEYTSKQWNVLSEKKERELVEAIRDEEGNTRENMEASFNRGANQLKNIVEMRLAGSITGVYHQGQEVNLQKNTIYIKPMEPLEEIQMIPYFASTENQYLTLNRELFPDMYSNGELLSYEYYPQSLAVAFTEENVDETIGEYYEYGFKEIDGRELLDFFEPGDYEEFIYENYLDYPEDSPELRKMIGRLYVRKNSSDWKGLNNEINDLLSEGFQYSKDPGSTPEGQDFIEDFLKKKKGFCVHYATVATMLYRAMGIPARYAEGYAIAKKDFRSIESGSRMEAVATDEMAHAWCEIYDGNVGWIPRDHTPGYMHTEEMTQQTVQNINPEPITKVKEPETASSKKEVTTPEQTSQEQKQNKNKPIVGKQPEQSEPVLVLIMVLAGILLAIGVIWGQYLIRRKNKEMKFKKNRNNLGMRYMVQELFQLCRASGIKVNQCTERQAFLIMKDRLNALDEEEWSWIYERGLVAAFSQETITREELSVMKKFLNRIRNQIWEEMNPFRKIFVKLVYAL